MKQGKNRRLANSKTRRETGLEYVMFNLDLNTPFGKKQLKDDTVCETEPDFD